MTEAVARQLRDGVAVGEQAPAVMVRDTLDTRAGPAISDHFFSSLCSNIEAARAQAKYDVARQLLTLLLHVSLLLLLIFCEHDAVTVKVISCVIRGVMFRVVCLVISSLEFRYCSVL